ncbi:2006_t:CDS:2 [Scutellospora calospora]|uniref:2006_t:CDS:1 n=1 Tax=Scutellospora calospora TaxID=85575 RepID=A0ACA9K489_9GLOM|nr:2006_t:CDS:2 [Scutellospora calospora]
MANNLEATSEVTSSSFSPMSSFSTDNNQTNTLDDIQTNSSEEEILDYNDDEFNIWEEIHKNDKFEIEEIMNLNMIDSEIILNRSSQNNEIEIIENNNYNPISVVERFFENNEFDETEIEHEILNRQNTIEDRSNSSNKEDGSSQSELEETLPKKFKFRQQNLKNYKE